MFKLFRAISTIWRIPILWSNIQADRVFKILKGLHERGFHKRLHVFFEEDWDKEEFQQITSSPALEYLYAVNLNFECDLVYQANLKKLAVHSDPGSSSLHILFRFLDSSTIQRTKYFVKLSHLIIQIHSVQDASLDNVMPFILKACFELLFNRYYQQSFGYSTEKQRIYCHKSHQNMPLDIYTWAVKERMFFYLFRTWTARKLVTVLTLN